MTKKEYMKPAMKVVELQHKCPILIGASSNYGLNSQLQEDDEVEEGW